MQDIGGSLGREKDLGGDEVSTVREGSFILGSQAGGVYSTAYQEATNTRNGQTNRKIEFTGPRFTVPIKTLIAY